MIKEKDLVPGRVIMPCPPSQQETSSLLPRPPTPMYMIVGFKTYPARRHSTSSLPAHKKTWEVVALEFGGKLRIIGVDANQFNKWKRAF